MIVVLGGIKGGSGKTTIATNLAVMRSESKKVLLVDADEQRSAWDWFQQRDEWVREMGGFCEKGLGVMTTAENFVAVCMSGKSIYSNLLKLKDDYDDIIVDTGGRDTTSQRSALCVADKLILPFKPSSIDIWTLVPIKGILSECVNPTLVVYAVISQADPSGKDNQEAMEVLKEYTEIHTLKSPIGNRKAFRNAASEGLGVCEMHPIDKKACLEMESLYASIYA
jgi:chromosome partitioning protein